MRTVLLALFLATTAFAAEPAFTFDKKAYYLRSDQNGIREYLTEGETFDGWTTLVSTRTFDGITDARAFAMQLLQRAKSTAPAANGHVLEKDGVYLVDFLVFPPEGSTKQFAEWNLWRITRKGDGLAALQFGRRFYDFSETSVEEIKSSRNRLIHALETWKVPR